MKKENTKINPLLIGAVVLAIVLLIWWLFAGSILEEDGSNEIQPEIIEQVG